MQKNQWQPLKNELNQWQVNGLTPQFWCRDDDAAKPGPILKQLADVSHGLPISLAVVPDWLQADLPSWIDENFENANILQHGWAHVSHTEAGQKKSEFGDERPIIKCMDDIKRGHELLKSSFSHRYQPIFVPPWNRISNKVVSQLPLTGHIALSVYGANDGGKTDIRRLNTHVDIINWRGNRGFIGTEQAIALCTAHLQAKRLGHPSIDLTEPTGILTHHMDHDTNCWQFLQELTEFSDQNPILNWVTPKEALS